MLFYFILEATVALLAGYGFYCALRAFANLLGVPRQLMVAIEVQTKEDADMLDVLLHEAYSAFFQKKRARVVVLFSQTLMDGTIGHGEDLFDKYSDLLDVYGAECYLIDP